MLVRNFDAKTKTKPSQCTQKLFSSSRTREVSKQTKKGENYAVPSDRKFLKVDHLVCMLSRKCAKKVFDLLQINRSCDFAKPTENIENHGN